MQLQTETGQHQAHPNSGRLDRRLRVAHDHEVVGVAHQRTQVRTPVLPDPVEHVQEDVRQQRRDDAPLRSPRQGPLHLPRLHHSCREPQPQQPKDTPVRDALANQRQQLRMVDAAEVVVDVGVQHVTAPARPADAKGLQRLRRAPPRPKPIRRATEVRLEDGAQHQRRGHLRNPVPDRRYPERSPPAISLGDVSPEDQLRPIPSRPQRRAELLEERIDTALFNLGQRLRIDARRATIPLDPPPRLPEDVIPPEPVHQGVEAPVRGPLGRGPQASLQIGALCREAHASRGSWVRSRRPCPRASLRPRRAHRRGPSLRPRYAARPSAVI